jgi:cell fate regulator YaaT (PSP1 superfamily)
MRSLNIINCERGYRAGQTAPGEIHYVPHEGCCKLSVYDWLRDIPEDRVYRIFEVRFKNTHKGFFYNANDLPLAKDDIVAVEASSGHDIGIISASGPIVLLQMRRHNVPVNTNELRKIYRKARQADIEKWQDAISREHRVMIKTRQIAAQFRLNMKVGDVEFQGDGTKAIFYYIADDRVDFRELIRALADEFHIRIEMKQIGARQEAGLIGGIGVCGRALCCAQWMSDFISVNTSSARTQELSLNPQKLAGQCSKLKCCLNYEVATYAEAQKDFPQVKNPLETLEGPAYLLKNDVLKGIMWFTFDPRNPVTQFAVPVARVKQILEMNRKGEKAEFLVENSHIPSAMPDFISSAGEDSITRFDQSKKRRNRPRGGQGRPKEERPRPLQARGQAQNPQQAKGPSQGPPHDQPTPQARNNDKRNKRRRRPSSQNRNNPNRNERQQ